MKIKISKLPFITFLEKHQVYVLHCICDLAPHKFENIHGTTPQIKVTARHATSIRSKSKIGIQQQKYPNTVTLFGLYFV